MNILPKKRWHVRTKENIARVRRDEAQAAEQEQERLRRVALAEQEFRTSTLRKQAAERRGVICETAGEQQAKLEPGQDAAQKDASIVGTLGHINFFAHLEDGERVAGPNEDFLRDQKEEKEKYEKSIGYLTYLGQGSREETKQKAWFETLPMDRQKERQQVNDEEVKRKAKALQDPLMVLKKLVGADRSDITGVSSAKRPAAESVPVSPHNPSKTTGTANTQNYSKGSSATDERSAKKRKKHVKREKCETNTKKRKHSRKRKRDESDDRRHIKSKKKGRRRSPSSSDSSSSEADDGAEQTEVRRIRLERLRAERLQRERQERQRADQLLLSRLGGGGGEQQPPAPERHVPPDQPRLLKQRYNAQFNPYLARQNYRQN